MMDENVRGTESVLRYLRLAAGLSGEDLALHTGVSLEDIVRFEEGSRQIPLDRSVKLADYFGIDITALLWDDMDVAVGLIPFPIERSDCGQTERSCNRREYRERVGSVGEEWIAQLEREKLEGTIYACAVNPNYASDESVHFDILSFTPEGECIYIETKSTAGDGNYPFYITAAELRFAEQCLYEGKNYELHRVSHAEDPALRKRQVYTAKMLLEQFRREPRSFTMWEKPEAV